MGRFDGTLARRLDFESTGILDGIVARRRPVMTRPRLLRGPHKYKVLEHRRRRAQITARRLLDLIG